MQKSFRVLQICCKIHAISFFIKCQNILDFFLKNAQIILRIFDHIQEKKIVIVYYFFIF
jgi:GTP cyclohydrolase III